MKEPQFDAGEVLQKIQKEHRKQRIFSYFSYLLGALIFFIVIWLVYYGSQKILKTDDLLAERDVLLAKSRQENEELREQNKLLTNTLTKAQDSIHVNSNIKEVKTILKNVESANFNVQAVNSNKSNVTATNSQITSPKLLIKNKVYVQIINEIQRKPVEELMRNIKINNYSFYGIELVERNIPITEIRYFRPDDKEKAERMAELLEKNSKIKANVVYTNLKAEINVLEIWFGKDAFWEPNK